MEHITGIKAASQNIAACMKSPANVRAQMVAEMASKLGKGTYEHSEQARATHTNGPRDVPRCGALSLIKRL